MEYQFINSVENGTIEFFSASFLSANDILLINFTNATELNIETVENFANAYADVILLPYLRRNNPNAEITKICECYETGLLTIFTNTPYFVQFIRNNENPCCNKYTGKPFAFETSYRVITRYNRTDGKSPIYYNKYANIFLNNSFHAN